MATRVLGHFLVRQHVVPGLRGHSYGHKSASFQQQRSVSKPLSTFSERVIIPAAILVIVLGLLRGIVFGPVRSLSFVFGTAYGFCQN
jgi:hypothetical protein